MLLPCTERWQGEKAELVQLHEADVDDRYLSWLQHPEVVRFLETRFEKPSLETLCRFVHQCNESPDAVLFAIRIPKPAPLHVGNIKLEPINRVHLTAEVGLLIGDPSARGRGIATEAIRLVCDIARHELGLRKLTAGCYAANIASRRAFERADFEVEGLRHSQVLFEGQPHDVVLLGRVL